MLDTLLPRGARDQDVLTLRRGRVLAVLMLVFIGMAALLGLVGTLVERNANALLPTLVQITLYGVILLVNRSGRVREAIWLFLAILSITPLALALIAGTPVPPVFFVGLVVAAAGAFGRPRDALLWATALTPLPLLINLLLYRSPLAPSAAIALPGGGVLPSLFALEFIALAVMWMLAGAAFLSSFLLTQALEDSQRARAQAEEAQQDLAAQQTALAEQNQVLQHSQNRLQHMVEALAVPIVPIAEGAGLLPLIGPIDDARIREVERRALAQAAAGRMRRLIIDLSGSVGLESGSAASLARLCSALRLLGVEVTLAGIGAKGALVLSGANIALPQTTATVEAALAQFQSVDVP